jgi:hypothetical protein
VTEYRKMKMGRKAFAKRDNSINTEVKVDSSEQREIL